MTSLPQPAPTYPPLLDDDRSRRFAARYDASYAAVERSFLGQLRRTLIAPLTGHVVEIGAGTGANVPWYAANPRLTQVDLVEPLGSMRALLSHRVATTPPAPGQRMRVVDGRGEALPQPAGSVDVVVATLVLCSVADVAATLREVRRVLRPDGVFVFIEHARASGPRRLLQHALTPLAVRHAAGCHYDRDQLGQIEAHVGRVDRLPVPAPWAARLLPEWPIVAGQVRLPPHHR